MKKLLWVLMAWTVYALPATAGDTMPMAMPAQIPPVQLPPTRLCTDADLTGSFVIANWVEKPVGEETNWYREYPFQYMIFNPGRKYDFVASRHALTKMEELKRALIMSMGEGLRVIVHKYTIDDEGLLNLYTDDRMEYSYRCMATLKSTGKNSQVGDIVLTGYTNKKSEITKLYRRWPAPL